MHTETALTLVQILEKTVSPGKNPYFPIYRACMAFHSGRQPTKLSPNVTVLNKSWSNTALAVYNVLHAKHIMIASHITEFGLRLNDKDA